MYKGFFTALATAVVFTLSAIASPVNSIKVSGVVRGIPEGGSRTLVVNECDIYEKSSRCIAELDSSGCFDVVVPFYRGHTFTINYNRKLFINAYAEPGDSVFVSIDASRTPIEFHLSGDHSQLNEEYSHAFCDLAGIYYDVTLLPDTVALSEYMPTFKSEVDRTKKVVEKYISDNSLSAETAELLYLDNIFCIANQAIGFRGNGPDETLAFFTDPIFDIMNEKNVKVMIFPYHLSALMFSCHDYLKSVPKSVIRDLMYAAAHDDVEAPARSEFADTAYYDRVYADNVASIDYSVLKPGAMVVMENDTVFEVDNVNPVEWLKSRYPSRPVYLDVSATWCGPCRAGLAAGEDARQFFKDKDVVFAVLWLKSDMKTWSKLVPDIHNAVHIFIPDDDTSNRIMTMLNLAGFPSYYIIDRQGKMSGNDVPHFNDSSLIDFLRSY